MLLPCFFSLSLAANESALVVLASRRRRRMWDPAMEAGASTPTLRISLCSKRGLCPTGCAHLRCGCVARMCVVRSRLCVGTREKGIYDVLPLFFFFFSLSERLCSFFLNLPPPPHALRITTPRVFPAWFTTTSAFIVSFFRPWATLSCIYSRRIEGANIGWRIERFRACNTFECRSSGNGGKAGK